MSGKISEKEKLVESTSSPQGLRRTVVAPTNGRGNSVSDEDWIKLCTTLIEIAKDAINLAKQACESNEQLCKNLEGKENEVSSLENDVQQYKEVNAALNLKANNIHITTVEDKPKPASPRKRGRPPGQPANKTFRPTRVDRTETLDFKKCPGCGKSHTLSGITDWYERIVPRLIITVENVQYKVVRRKCSYCKRKVHLDIPGVLPYARHDIIYEGIVTVLNLLGLSHGKCAKLSGEAFKVKTSRPSMYRAKIRISKALRPGFEHVKKNILKERYVNADEIWWPIVELVDAKKDIDAKEQQKVSSGNDNAKGGIDTKEQQKVSSGNDNAKKDPKNKRKSKSSGFVIIIRGQKFCLAIVSKTRKITKLKEILPDYKGITISDSLPNWLHIGEDHQMCIVHQKGNIKDTLKYQIVDEETKEFLNNLMQLFKRGTEADKLTDQDARNEAADKIDTALEALYARDYKDQFKIISRFRKRYRREKNYLTTHLRKNVPSDNNSVERSGRVLVACRNDGGGNRSVKGMEANSILFTNMLTDWISNRSFFDHIVLAASGDG